MKKLINKAYMIILLSTPIVMVIQMHAAAGRKEAAIVAANKGIVSGKTTETNLPPVATISQPLSKKTSEVLKGVSRYLGYVPESIKEKEGKTLNETRKEILEEKNKANYYLLLLNLNDMGFKGTYDNIKFPLAATAAKEVSVASLKAGIASNKQKIEKLSTIEYEQKKMLGLYSWSDYLKKYSRYLPGYKRLSKQASY